MPVSKVHPFAPYSRGFIARMGLLMHCTAIPTFASLQYKYKHPSI